MENIDIAGETLREYIGKEIKVYLSKKNPYNSYIGTLLNVKTGSIVVKCSVKTNTEEKTFLFFEKNEYITKIICAETWNKTLYQVISIPEEALAEIRNTLGPVKNLLALLESEQKDTPVVQEMIKREIEKSKVAVEYLSNFQVL